MNYNGTEYFYVTNLQGDVIELLDSQGNPVVSYQYDAWGTILHQTGGALAVLNPYRYRGYRYDSETQWYYLQSRYYDSSIGRFISSDGLVGEVGNLVSQNMYTYEANNPVYSVSFSAASGGIGSIGVSNRYNYSCTNIIPSIVNSLSRARNSIFSTSFKLASVQRRTSFGWDTTPTIATGWFGRIGFSSYITESIGGNGLLYAFYGSQTDPMAVLSGGTEYFAGQV